MVVLLVWVLFGLVGAAIGQTRCRPVAGFLLGMLLGPIGWLLIAFSDGRPQCPACRERIQPAAAVCGHCRAALAWIAGRPLLDDRQSRQRARQAERLAGDDDWQRQTVDRRAGVGK